MARNGKLESYSVKELRKLRDRIDIAIVERQKSERIQLRVKMQALAKDYGFAIDDVLGTARGRGGKGTVTIKYRNPKDSTQTWTGRGRMPLWLVHKLKKRGVSREDFAV
jgi:DNA-binding protein H-NS